MAQRGQVTIPKSLRDRHRWETGQQFTFIDLGGLVVMSPTESRIDSLANELRDGLLKEGASLEEMLDELRKLREADGR
jgi:bifunctional DNA-binding transcriptional regulator/antitoxin component of YhaV-PrlF toxin-antitoxin module